jgi:hypothetical protein
MSDEADQVHDLVEAVSPFFVGKPTQVQGAALADLLAIWLAGHVNPDDPSKSARIREEMLELHLKAVRALIPINYATHIEPKLKARRH